MKILVFKWRFHYFFLSLSVLSSLFLTSKFLINGLIFVVLSLHNFSFFFNGHRVNIFFSCPGNCRRIKGDDGGDGL